MANRNGPKSLPTAMKVLKGTDQPCRTNKREPKLPVERSLAPKWLSKKAQEIYLELSDVLVGMQVLTKADQTALEMLCDAYAEYREARAYIEDKGMTYETTATSGDVIYKVYPQVAIASDAYKRIRSMMTEFGLTPASRSKVSAAGEEEKDPLGDYMNG
jgi:P27 family predicted phage terminase small subunit